MFEVFGTNDYKIVLNRYIQKASLETKGIKTNLANVIGCRTSYLSQILNGNAHLSLEQAERLARHLRLSSLEREYFFLMILYARAGTENLKECFLEKMNEIVKMVSAT